MTAVNDPPLLRRVNALRTTDNRTNWLYLAREYVWILLVVGLAGLKLRAETGANAVVVSMTMFATGVVLVLFAIDTARNAPQTFTAMIVIGVLAVVLDAVWKLVRPTSVPAVSTDR